jgi:uncharacterized membrane protein YdbT with pleckstrin-like domain
MDNQFHMKLKPALRLVTAYELVLTLVCVQGYNLSTAQAHEVFWLALFVGSIPVYVYFFFQRLFDNYELTADYVAMKTGVFWRRATRIPLSKITDASASRRLLARFLGVGSVLFNSPGSNHYEVVMRDLRMRDVSRIIEFFESRVAGGQLSQGAAVSAAQDAAR